MGKKKQFLKYAVKCNTDVTCYVPDHLLVSVFNIFIMLIPSCLKIEQDCSQNQVMVSQDLSFSGTWRRVSIT
jgi:hypothetical protein